MVLKDCIDCPEGPQGILGSDGASGSTGVQGLRGFQGSQGNAGYPGTIGFAGFQGLQGSQGVFGDTGPQAVEGFQGVQGTQGNQGTQGFGGLAGLQGESGFHTADSDSFELTGGTTTQTADLLVQSKGATAYSLTGALSFKSGLWITGMDASINSAVNKSVRYPGTTQYNTDAYMFRIMLGSTGQPLIDPVDQGGGAIQTVTRTIAITYPEFQTNVYYPPGEEPPQPWQLWTAVPSLVISNTTKRSVRSYGMVSVRSGIVGTNSGGVTYGRMETCVEFSATGGFAGTADDMHEAYLYIPEHVANRTLSKTSDNMLWTSGSVAIASGGAVDSVASSSSYFYTKGNQFRPFGRFDTAGLQTVSRLVQYAIWTNG